LIATPPELEEFLDRIADLPVVALDTEADSLHCYFEKLCLIQASTPHEHTLIDPLADVPMQPLLDALSDKRVVFHGADYDLRMLRRVGSVEPREIFDTMIAARLCGFEGLGLAALVERYFGVKLSKGSQKANWAIRPLSSEMAEYAINDTRYLLPLSELVEAELHRLGRWEWFAESRDRMVASSREVRERDEETIWRIAGSSKLSPRAQSVLRVLWFWRDAESRSWDRPPFHVMSNDDLLRLAERASSGQAFSTPRLTHRRRRSFDIALALALQIPESEWPRQERHRGRRRTLEQIKIFDDLKLVRDRIAKEIQIDPAILASRGALEAVSIDPDSPLLMTWQRRLLGLPVPQPDGHG
jgi:ribonuclease D